MCYLCYYSNKSNRTTFCSKIVECACNGYWLHSCRLRISFNFTRGDRLWRWVDSPCCWEHLFWAAHEFWSVIWYNFHSGVQFIDNKKRWFWYNNFRVNDDFVCILCFWGIIFYLRRFEAVNRAENFKRRGSRVTQRFWQRNGRCRSDNRIFLIDSIKFQFIKYFNLINILI